MSTLDDVGELLAAARVTENREAAIMYLANARVALAEARDRLASLDLFLKSLEAQLAINAAAPTAP